MSRPQAARCGSDQRQSRYAGSTSTEQARNPPSPGAPATGTITPPAKQPTAERPPSSASSTCVRRDRRAAVQAWGTVQTGRARRPHPIGAVSDRRPADVQGDGRAIDRTRPGAPKPSARAFGRTTPPLRAGASPPSAASLDGPVPLGPPKRAVDMSDRLHHLLLDTADA